MRVWILSLVMAFAATTTAYANTVGETHRQGTVASGVVRNADHSTALRITVWYPAQGDAEELPLDMGPPGRPFFVSGSAANEAPFAQGRYPVILLSHGFGGTARMMGWFGTAMARAGYVVVAVDHPGNNGMDTMTAAGAMLWWERAEDLKQALEVTGHDAVIGPHMDMSRLGVSGFSAGGFTTLVASGARVNIDRLLAFCKAHPADGVCEPQKEAPELTGEKGLKALKDPALKPWVSQAGNDHSVPGVRAAFAMAPAIVQALVPESLKAIPLRTSILLGDADVVAPPSTNGVVAASLLPHATMKTLPGVGHYDFLGQCTEAGREATPLCKISQPQEPTHKAAIDAARALFDSTLKQ
ncbi:putative dienelactone hydrolase [Luteibacter sp. Sphag1AF]|uniref:alpha/beta hydrolase family protein n=1 Tax=Luteibacter sp. Sphag1AF TaxID=2587031 RepID=UPI00160FC86E|nr:dienelactone hydrolase family protein [Luteibacter sp. Sphag1AF]MBB3225947.1 putative dienelactone hydrolase [Luteibacter sp. Sphag1AF]